MAREIRFGDFLRQVSLEQQLSYKALIPDIAKDMGGSELSCYSPRLLVRGIDGYRILQPCVSV